MAQSIKDYLLVTDMDGTLLTTEKKLSDENIRAIHEFQNAGGRFSIATGRTIPSLYQYLEKIHLDAPAIVFNGTTLYDYDKKEILWHQPISMNAKRYTEEVIKNFPDVGVEIFMEDRISVVHLNDIVRHHMDIEKLHFEETTIEKVEGEWFKVLFATEPERIDEIEVFLKEYGCPDVDLVRSFTHYYEMLPKDCSKGTGLKELSRVTGIPLSDIVAIGDFYNDRTMIQTAGTGVCVANAPDELKAMAAMVVCDNDHSAIADLIHRLMSQF